VCQNVGAGWRLTNACVLNSDIVYSDQLIVGALPTGLRSLVQAAANRGDVIVLPSTSLLEFERTQGQAVSKAIASLEAAYKQLDRFGVAYTRVEPSDIVHVPDLVGLMRANGAVIEVEEPTLADLQEAHRRACLHEIPHPPDIKSDEMRDLVIWMVALRLAAQDGRALLVSRDQVHVHTRGNLEASQAGLIRVSTIEDALEYLEVETPAGQLVRQLLEPLWHQIVISGVPVAERSTILGASQAQFTQGERALRRARFVLKTLGTDDKPLRATVDVGLTDGAVTNIEFRDVRLGNEVLSKVYQIKIEGTEASLDSGYPERLEALRSAIGAEE